ncbi:MAG: hypothetical protein IPL78_23145 [Chloroflexi bacterium]|nr:hypothetical protein [Chloroflexota bacterium]
MPYPPPSSPAPSTSWVSAHRLCKPTLTAKLEASIQRLYGFQHDDGGWGWWHDDDSHDYQTAWVIFGLTTMADAGYTIDPAVISRGRNGSMTIWQRWTQTRAYALYSLAVAGQGNRPKPCLWLIRWNRLIRSARPGWPWPCGSWVKRPKPRRL